jgi:hypothetical protein
MVVVMTVVIPVIHVAILTLSFNLLSALFDVSPALSMTLDFALKILLGLLNALLAIAPRIGQQGQSSANEQNSSEDCCNHCVLLDHLHSSRAQIRFRAESVLRFMSLDNGQN